MPEKTKTILFILLSLTLLYCAPSWSLGESFSGNLSVGKSPVGKVALIIDDMGYNLHDQDAIAINGPLTYSILPHTPYAIEYAKQLRKANKDVMLHIPMEALSGKLLGPGALLSNMTRSQVETRLENALDEIPFAIGVNNHMGSLLTQKGQIMQWTMEFLSRNGLFFLDSKTSRYSLGEQYARQVGIPSFHRNVFLDNELSEQAMMTQFNQLILIAQKYRHAIGIAHPYPETVKFLNKMLPKLAEHGVELVAISSLLPAKMRFARQAVISTM